MTTSSSSTTNNNIHPQHQDSNNNNNDLPIRRIGTKRQKGCCSFKPPLRLVLGIYIILNAIIITALVVGVNFVIYEAALLELGSSFQRLITVRTRDETSSFFEAPVRFSDVVVTTLFTTDGFMIPSDNQDLNATHPMTSSLNTILRTSVESSLAFSLFFDDGSQYITSLQNLNYTAAGIGQSDSDDRDFAIVSAFVSKDFEVTEAAVYRQNLTQIPISSPLVESYNLSLSSATRPPFYNITKSEAIKRNDFSFSWGEAIAIKTTPSQTPYLALSTAQPVLNSSGAFVAIFGIAVDTSFLTDFLRRVLRETGSNKNMQAMILDSSLTIYATTLNLPTAEEKIIASGETIPVGCLATTASISSSANTNVVLCSKTAMNVGYTPARKFFERYSYALVVNEFDNQTIQYYSGIYDQVPKGGLLSEDVEVRDDSGLLHIATFARLDNEIANFVLSTAFFTSVDEYYSEIIQGQAIMIGVSVASVIISIILVDLIARHYLLPLEDVANLMVATSQLRFDTESQFINKKGYLAHGKNERINRKRTKVTKSFSSRRGSTVSNAAAASVDSPDEIEFYHRSVSDEDDEDMDEKEIERKQKQEVEDSLSPIAEIRALQKAQMNMSNALNSFTKYLSRSIVQELQVSGISLGMSKKRATVVLQSDISGFTTLSESVPPNVLSDLLTIYFEKINGIVISHGLVILMFVGDAVFAVSSSIFGGYGNDELKAALCALEMQRTASIHPLTEAWDRLANKRLWQRIGINCGEIFAGITGSSSRLTYTVSGPNADFAQYLEAAGKTFGTLTTVSSTVAAKVKHVFALRLLIPIKLALTYNSPQLPENFAPDIFSTYTSSYDNAFKDLATGPPHVRAKEVNNNIIHHPENILPAQHHPRTDKEETDGLSPAAVSSLRGNPLSFPTCDSFSNTAQASGRKELASFSANNTAADTSSHFQFNNYNNNSNNNSFSTSLFHQGFSETASTLLGGLPGTVLNAYELVGLLPNVNIDEAIKPESAFVKRTSDSVVDEDAQESGDDDNEISGGLDPLSGSHNNNNNNRNNNTDNVHQTTQPQKRNNKSSVAFVEVPDHDGVVRSPITTADGENPQGVFVLPDVTPPQSSCGSEVSNESFLARVAANPLFYLPADNLFQRGYDHKKCTYIASGLEIRFSREWSHIVRLFAHGELKRCVEAVQEIKRRPEYGIFFAEVKEFGSEDEYEKMYRECIGNDRKCAATFIRANKSEKILVQTCEEVLEQQEKGLEHTFAMKM